MDCLDLTIINDIILESTEDLFGQLESFVVNGLPTQSIEGVELNPAQTVIQIQDNDGILATRHIATVSDVNITLTTLQLSLLDLNR